MIKILRILAFIASMGFLVLPFYFAAGPRGFLGQKFDTVGYLAIAILLYLGILFGALHRQLIRTTDEVNIIKEIQKLFSSKHFWIAIVCSPLVLVGIYAVLQEKPIDIAAMALTFQNGFFCERIVAGMAKKEPIRY